MHPAGRTGQHQLFQRLLAEEGVAGDNDFPDNGAYALVNNKTEFLDRDGFLHCCFGFYFDGHIGITRLVVFFIYVADAFSQPRATPVS